MCLHGLCALMLELLVRRVSVPAWGANVWACDCLHWMLSTLMCSSTGALVGHVRVPAYGVSSTWLCSDAGAVVWACKCAADIGALMLV